MKTAVLSAILADVIAASHPAGLLPRQLSQHLLWGQQKVQIFIVIRKSAGY